MTWNDVIGFVTSEPGQKLGLSLAGGAASVAGGLLIWALVIVLRAAGTGLVRAGSWLVARVTPAPKAPPEPLRIDAKVAALVDGLVYAGKREPGWIVAPSGARVAVGKKRDNGESRVTEPSSPGGYDVAAEGSVWAGTDDISKHYTDEERTVIYGAALRRLAHFEDQDREAARALACGHAENGCVLSLDEDAAADVLMLDTHAPQERPHVPCVCLPGQPGCNCGSQYAARQRAAKR